MKYESAQNNDIALVMFLNEVYVYFKWGFVCIYGQ